MVLEEARIGGTGKPGKTIGPTEALDSVDGIFKLLSRIPKQALTALQGNLCKLCESWHSRGRGEHMGRKVSVNERSATEACREILKTTRDQHVRLQAAKLLLENESGNKDRAGARQRQRFAHAQNKELANLSAQVASLQQQLQSANETIKEAKEQKEADIVKNMAER